MADIVRTAALVRPMDPNRAMTFPSIAVEAIAAGQVVAPTAGGVNLADANAAGARQQPCGIAMNDAAIGQAVTVHYHGPLWGYDVSALTPGVSLFLSDNAGEVADTASGTKTVRLGRVIQTSAKSLDKYFFVDTDFTNSW